MRRDIVDAVNKELLPRGFPKLAEHTGLPDLIAILTLVLLTQGVRVEPKKKTASAE